jgi:hypothetical protein
MGIATLYSTIGHPIQLETQRQPFIEVFIFIERKESQPLPKREEPKARCHQFGEWGKPKTGQPKPTKVHQKENPNESK